MRNFRNLALGLVAAAAVASASDVHDLKTDSFPDFVKENPLVLAECKYSPGCDPLRHLGLSPAVCS